MATQNVNHDAQGEAKAINGVFDPMGFYDRDVPGLIPGTEYGQSANVLRENGNIYDYSAMPTALGVSSFAQKTGTGMQAVRALAREGCNEYAIVVRFTPSWWSPVTTWATYPTWDGSEWTIPKRVQNVSTGALDGNTSFLITPKWILWVRLTYYHNEGAAVPVFNINAEAGITYAAPSGTKVSYNNYYYWPNRTSPPPIFYGLLEHVSGSPVNTVYLTNFEIGVCLDEYIPTRSFA